MNLAIVTPNQNVYSETFIQAHKQIDAEVFFYYGGGIPTHLEGFGPIDQTRLKKFTLFKKGWMIIFNKDYSYEERLFLKSLRSNKIDVVLAEYGFTGTAIINVCKRLKIPIVVVFHGYDAYNNEILESCQTKYFELFQYAHKTFAVSNAMKSKLISLGCPSDKILLAIYGPNNKFLEIHPTFKESRSFVSIGRFVNKKAPYYIILAIKKVAEKYPDVKLYYAGNGELYETAQNLVSYFKLEKNIVFLGVITPDEYVSLLTKVTGFIQHSIKAANGDMEGTPVAVIEASGAGIPVIATNHAGIPDVIINGETGLLVEEHNVDDMANQIIKLIENPDLAKKLGKNGKENIKINFSMCKHLNIIKSALLNAIDSKIID